MKELRTSVKEVRSKKAIYKLNHKLNAKLRARSKNKNLTEMIDHFESKGLSVNKESLRSRSKVRKTLGELEGNKDKLAKKALDDSDDGSVISDEEMAANEAK